MSDEKFIKVALVGNPNTGKTSLFNQLTGLKQKVGNYPGVTVDRKHGTCKLTEKVSATIIDLPGTYSINPSTLDENIVLNSLLNPTNDEHPDVIVVVADIENIKRNLFLFTQLKDLEVPTILAINMADRMKRKGISIDLDVLKDELNAEIVLISARKNIGIIELKKAIANYKNINTKTVADISSNIDENYFNNVKNIYKNESLYTAWLKITQANNLPFLSYEEREKSKSFNKDYKLLTKLQHRETILRYQIINNVLKKAYTVDAHAATGIQSKLDKILTHKIFGYVIFATILLVIFQSIFNWALLPMNYISSFFAFLGGWIKSVLPSGVLTNLISDGIIPGIGGILIFIPQIAILFFFISVLEESGYMSRVVFLMDKTMRKFGMSGKSVVPLISGTACAIPAIMATRNIEGWKERLITILVTPFTTCSARLPVYAIIIALIIPNKRILGIFNLQGLTLMLLYLIGFGTAILAAIILNKILKIKKKRFFVMEMPSYKIPSLKNIFITVVEKTKTFVFVAGKIILSISIVLWFLASSGPATFKNATLHITQQYKTENLSKKELQTKIDSYKLRHSYIGVIGKTIQPVLKPLGFDWKIGIALISSFAAREVFVGTLATIYSVENSSNTNTNIIERLRTEKNPETGKPMFTFAVGMSLLMFYVFAMQCMSTLAIVKRETNSWKWPMYQLFGMTGFAYLVSFITYHFLA